jgi:AraC-like DNA-binding protein
MTTTPLTGGGTPALPTRGDSGHSVEVVVAPAPAPAHDEERDAAGSSHRTDLFAASQSVIREHFRDPRFDVAELARRLNMSVSHLHRLFSAEGTTPKREIERYRLEDVQRRLAEIRTFESIVDQAGFRSLRHFKATAARFRAVPGRAG